MLNINGKEIEVIIDSGAGPNVISNKLRKKLGIPIKDKSNERCILANGQSIASLGKTEILIEIDEELEIPIEVEVIDSKSEELIIGNDTLGAEWEANIDFKEKVLTIENDEEVIDIPIKYEIEGDLEENETDEEESEEEFIEYDYEEGDKRILYTIVRDEENDEEMYELEENEVKANVLA